MPAVPASAFRLVALALVAALWGVEHLRLARAARRELRPPPWAAAWLVPGVGAVSAWRRGARSSAVLHAALAVAYLALRFLP
jgi:hypothetical protein